ncbi:CBM35 domain-containing protein [Streptomyces sp. ME19-01-6]|uniref:CBM35 domain-containing protein n=1 Tax=Streptomyces sp. ME19-01-6 TaxID=3028686 RepID=UPI0029A432B6|nr:CBM35 domain-containing protein [Streptomyces sp. ME19-01-6]MDX3227261.1 CBM35 domain-containing protein [Streptomyces sp. ME19-01-6]
MTAGNNGSDTPENDDPFAYLYRSEGGQDGQPGQSGSAPRTGGYGYPGPAAPHQPGVPRTSYNHVRAVGERTYGQQNQQQYQQGQQIPNQQAYGRQGQQQGHGQQNAHYAAPETMPGGAPRQPAPSRGGRGRGPNNKGLLIGALAVVAVVVVGIGVAMLTNNDGNKDDKADPTNSPTAGASVKPSETAEPSKKPSALPTEDAWGMRLEGGAAPATDIPGAKAEGGKYVGGMNAPGASVTWNVDVAKAGQYRVYARYGVPGENQSLSLTVNGERSTRPINMENFVPGAKKGDWEKSWTSTWSLVNLNEGTNTVKVSCEAGDKCEVILDQLWLTGKDG